MVHGVAKSWTPLSNFTFTTRAIARRLEKAHLNPSSALSNWTEPYFDRKKVFSQFVILTEDEASFCQEKSVEICSYAFEQFGKKKKKKIIFLKKLLPPKIIYASNSTKPGYTLDTK